MAEPKQARRARGTGSVFYHQHRKVWVGRAVVNGKLVERSDPSQAEMLRKLATARPPDPHKTTVGEWLARWLSEQSVRPGTLRIRTHACRAYLAPSLGKLRLAALTPHLVERAVASWEATLPSANSRRLNLAVLSTACEAAVKTGLLAKNPVKAATKPKGAKAKIDPFTAAELASIVAEATARPTCRVFALLATTGCRFGEALALDAGEFDPAAGTVSISTTLAPDRSRGPTKSANGVRTLRVPDAALPACRAAHGGRRKGPLFRNAGGRRAAHDNQRWVWQWMLKRLGIRYRNVHQLRHSVASHALAAGYGPADVAKHLGDSPETIIRTYCHATGQDVSAGMDRLLAGVSETKIVKCAKGGRGQAR
jgi:integrase